MAYAILLALLGAGLGTLAVLARGLEGIFLGWVGVTFFAVGVMYFIGAHRTFGKRLDGTIGPMRWAFLPFLATMRGVHETLRKLSGERAFARHRDQPLAPPDLRARQFCLRQGELLRGRP